MREPEEPVLAFADECLCEFGVCCGFVASWADAAEEEEVEQERDSSCSTSSCTSSSRQAELARGKKKVYVSWEEWEELKYVREVLGRDNERSFCKRKKKRAAERGRKLFVGGVIFKDLQMFLKDHVEVDCMGDFSVPSLFCLSNLLSELRAELFVFMLREFGRIEQIKPCWSKRYCHVVYASKESADVAFEVLSKTEERRSRVANLAHCLSCLSLPTFISPLSDFYVRWPSNNNKSKNKRGNKNSKAKRKGKAKAKVDTNESDDPELVAKHTTSGMDVVNHNDNRSGDDGDNYTRSMGVCVGNDNVDCAGSACAHNSRGECHDNHEPEHNMNVDCHENNGGLGHNVRVGVVGCETNSTESGGVGDDVRVVSAEEGGDKMSYEVMVPLVGACSWEGQRNEEIAVLLVLCVLSLYLLPVLLRLRCLMCFFSLRNPNGNDNNNNLHH
eukprot:CAMPEP_0174259110 /NCGR_PEP_ID=MMETSP0439-20130205/7989_1 /TAXON_ID=0 /ORGANISM="Stereomyxa ramosa, Strain Chinc5" /LENGTH=443 /DNA_ID=CAMNT_0015342881 /DNA_START=133 /DNA_END=1464 /DNA_ORIENTATION=+